MNILIVEDEKQTAALLKEMIEQDSDCLVVQSLEAVTETVAYLSKHQHQLDLLFFDIQLADGHSFEIFKHIDVTVPVVFCTAYDQFTMQAIKNNGIDYILKPFKEEEIRLALEKYRQLIQTLSKRTTNISSNWQPTKANTYQQSFLTQIRDKTLVVHIRDIAAFHFENGMVHLYTFTGKKYPLFKKLEYVESVCDPEQFFRINRQMLINREAVVSIVPYFHRKVSLQLKVALSESPIVSRLKVSPFKDWLERAV